MLVAATILRLAEERQLGLEDPIARFLPSRLIEGLARFEGVDYGAKITIRQCLEHTSGLWDCYGDGLRDAAGRTPFEQELIRQPNKFWTSEEVISWNKTRLQAVAPPGVRFHYSDTGYQLLGLVIESAAKKTLAAAVRDFVIDPLKLTDTYAEFRENPHRSPGIVRSHSFDQEVDRTDALSETADWGGGGWVANAPDLARFLCGISQGQLFRNPATWQLMQAWSAPSSGTYGLGLERFTTPAQEELLGHGGFYGSIAVIWPKAEMIIVATINQSMPSKKQGHTEVVMEIVEKICAAAHGLHLVEGRSGQGSIRLQP